MCVVWRLDRLGRNLADFDPALRQTRTAQDPLRIAAGAALSEYHSVDTLQGT